MEWLRERGGNEKGNRVGACGTYKIIKTVFFSIDISPIYVIINPYEGVEKIKYDLHL